MYATFVNVDVHVRMTGDPSPVVPDAGLVFTSGAAAATVNVRHPPVASVVPVAFVARTCHSYVAPAVSPLTGADVAVPTLGQVPEHVPFTVLSRQYV